MQIECWSIGKTAEPYLQEGLEVYTQRLRRYIPFNWVELPDVKPRPSDKGALTRMEGQLILQKLKPDDYLVLLDERGQEFASRELALWMQKHMNRSPKRLVFLVGGAYGFSDELYARAQEKWSLSRLTFSHQMIRLFLAEQLYRAMTILNNEPYHNQ